MLKNILDLEGAQKLTKNEQKEVNGGIGGGYTYCPITKDECLDRFGKWNIYQNMCVIEASECY
jgi:hypothetical protein